MATQTVDMLREIGQPATESALLTLLREMAQEMTDCRRYLGRLVAMEEERREGERQMEALAEALQPSNGQQPFTPAADLDWYRDPDGYYRERGTDRSLTEDEVMAVTYSPRREARRSR